MNSKRNAEQKRRARALPRQWYQRREGGNGFERVGISLDEQPVFELLFRNLRRKRAEILCLLGILDEMERAILRLQVAPEEPGTRNRTDDQASDGKDFFEVHGLDSYLFNVTHTRLVSSSRRKKADDGSAFLLDIVQFIPPTPNTY